MHDLCLSDLVPLIFDFSMAHASSTDHHDHAHHAIPVKRLLVTFAWLVGLTGLTVATGTSHAVPSVLHVPLALSIAAVKCFLVVSFFMGLKYDKPVNLLAFLMSGVFVLIFLTFTLFDTANRGDLGNVAEETVMDMTAIAREDSVRLERYSKLRVAPGDSAQVATPPPGAPAVGGVDAGDGPATQSDSAAALASPVDSLTQH